MLESVFIETTIPSYYVARPSRNLVQAARQQLTIEWWDYHRRKFRLFTNQSVINEISRGDKKMAHARKLLLGDIPLVDLNDSVATAAQRLIDNGLIPQKASEDAIHIASAAVHGIDYLLTWNCRHIANPQIRRQIRSIFRTSGIGMPVICTPEEFL